MMPQAIGVHPTTLAAPARRPMAAVVAAVPQAEPLRSRFDLGTLAAGSAQARIGRSVSTRLMQRAEPEPSPPPAEMGAPALCLAISRTGRKESSECPAKAVDTGRAPWAQGRRGSFLAVSKPIAARHRIISLKFQVVNSIAAAQLDAADLFLIVSALSLAVACILRLLGD